MFSILTQRRGFLRPNGLCEPMILVEKENSVVFPKTSALMLVSVF